MDAFQDALLSISPKQSFEHAVQILHGTPLLRGRELLPAWRWTPNANAELETEGRLSTTHLESFNQQLLGATLVQSLSWLVDGAGNVLQEQQASVEQQRQQQLAESAPGSSPSSQHPQAETQTSSSSSSSSSSREGLPSDNPASQLLHQALDLVHLFVDLLYAGAAAEADAVWAQAQQQGGDLQEAAAAGARSFQHLADAGEHQVACCIAPAAPGAQQACSRKLRVRPCQQGTVGWGCAYTATSPPLSGAFGAYLTCDSPCFQSARPDLPDSVLAQQDLVHRLRCVGSQW
jgi:hypothetical protein